MLKETKNKSLYRRESVDILNLSRRERNSRIPEEIEIEQVYMKITDGLLPMSSCTAMFVEVGILADCVKGKAKAPGCHPNTSTVSWARRNFTPRASG